jgi:hypothetical protein
MTRGSWLALSLVPLTCLDCYPMTSITAARINKTFTFLRAPGPDAIETIGVSLILRGTAYAWVRQRKPSKDTLYGPYGLSAMHRASTNNAGAIIPLRELQG